MGHKSDTEALSDAGLTLDQRQATDGTPEFLVAGETHPYRKALRHAGGSWNKLKRVWTFAGEDPLPGIAAAIRKQPANPDRGLDDSAGGNKPHYWGENSFLILCGIAGLGSIRVSFVRVSCSCVITGSASLMAIAWSLVA